MTNLTSDLRYGFRLLAKSPGFTAISVITLAVAIGANSAIFSLINGVLLRPLIYDRPEQVVAVYNARKGPAREFRQFSHPEYRQLRDSRELFADVTAIGFSQVGLGANDGTVRRNLALVVPENYMAFVGSQPLLGRFFNAREAEPNANEAVLVAGYDLWQRYGGRPDFVGSSLLVNGRPHTVVGVAPKGFNGVSTVVSPDLFLPLGVYGNLGGSFTTSERAPDLNDPTRFVLNIIARLSPGLTLDSARARLPVLGERLAAQSASAREPREIQLHPPMRYNLSTSPEDESMFNLVGVVMAGMAALILVIASLNLANMLLARGSARAREIAVRLALGASRGMIVRQLLTEGLLLALAGGAGGVALSYAANTGLQRSMGTLLGVMNFNFAGELRPDGTVLGATFLLCLVATLLFSLGPALKAAKANLVTDLKAQAGEAAVTGRWNKFFAPRHLLVMAQMTFSLVLIFVAGLFFRGAMAAAQVSLGFKPDGVVVTELDFSLGGRSNSEAQRTAFAAVDRLRAMPGVAAAGLTTLMPYGNTTRGARLVPSAEAVAPNPDPASPAPGASAVGAAVTPGYFDSIGVRLLRGRDFSESEARDPAANRVCILDEGMAQRLFPDRDPLGQRVRFSQNVGGQSAQDMEIVGIVSRHRHDIQDRNGPTRRYFLPLAQQYSPNLFLTVAFSNSNPVATLNAVGVVRSELQSLDANLPAIRIVPFTTLMSGSITLWAVRTGATLFGIFGTIALLLAVVGVYGVKAYAVERRTREIGIRLAIGATRRDVFTLIMKQGALQTGLSVAFGLVIALLLGQVLGTIVYGVSPRDPVAILLASAALGLSTLLACYIPALRAMRISPTVALRTE